jgi:hypothetical protein
MTSEEWRPVEGWPYEVSNLGRVRRAADAVLWNGAIAFPKGYVLRPRPHKAGYQTVSLCAGGRPKGFLISRLVCTAFNGAPPSVEHEAAHWDGDKTNNRATNLRWATGVENAADKIRHDRVSRGSRQGRAKLTESNVIEIRALIAAGVPQRQIAKRFGVTKSPINEIHRGRAWSWLT